MNDYQQLQLDENDWRVLLDRIQSKECTPFLGAGICYNTLPLGGEIASEWADDYQYPLAESRRELPLVAQYLAVTHDPMFPKNQIIRKWFSADKLPDYDLPNEPHWLLAGLPLPIYLTTNYDDFMFQALQRHGKKPRLDMCRWNHYMQTKYKESILDSYEPTVDEPLVFHIHGHKDEKRSLVLTEDDYLDFLVHVSKDRDNILIPPRIQEALVTTSLLFIGYSLQDWNFRVLFRGFLADQDPTLRQISIAVQLLPSDAPDAAPYMRKYFGNMNVRVYWGTANQFAAELRKRWKALNDGTQPP